MYIGLRRFGRNRNITPDNKCLIFYIYIWTLNIDIQSLYIYMLYKFLSLLNYSYNLEMPSKELRNVGLFKKNKNAKSII